MKLFVTACLIASVGIGALFAMQTPARTSSGRDSQTMDKGMLVRISEIQIDASYLEEYTAILKEEAEASVRLEPGVISIFPMYQKYNPTEIRILEIYASR